MKFLEFLEKDLSANLSVDIVHLMCPIHLLELNESIKKIEVGQILIKVIGLALPKLSSEK